MSGTSKPVTRADTKSAPKNLCFANHPGDPSGDTGGNTSSNVESKSASSGQGNQVEEQVKTLSKKSSGKFRHTYDNEKMVPVPKFNYLVINQKNWRNFGPEWELYKKRGGTLPLINLFTDRQLQQLQHLHIDPTIAEKELIAELDQHFLYYSHVTEVLADLQTLPAPKLGNEFDDESFEELHCCLDKMQKIVRFAGNHLPVKSFVKSNIRRLFLTSGYVGRIVWNQIEGTFDDEELKILNSREYLDKICESALQEFVCMRPYFDVVRSASQLANPAGRFRGRAEPIQEEAKIPFRDDKPVAPTSYAAMAAEDQKKLSRDEKTVTKPSYASMAAKPYPPSYAPRKPYQAYKPYQARTVTTSNKIDVKVDEHGDQDEHDDQDDKMYEDEWFDRQSVYDPPDVQQMKETTDDLLTIHTGAISMHDPP